MRSAKPAWEAMDTHAFGLGALLLALLVPGSAWLVAYASMAAPDGQDARQVEFIRSTAAIQGRLHFVRAMEKNVVAAASPQRTGYYRDRRDEARRRIDELVRGAASVAEGPEEQARLGQLAVLVRAADTRFARVLASLEEVRGSQRLAMQR